MLSLSITASVLQQPNDRWTFVNTAASKMVNSFLFCVKIIRVCKNFWMDIILNKSETFHLEIIDVVRDNMASMPLLAH